MTVIQQISALVNQISTIAELKQVGDIYRAKYSALQALENAKALISIYPGASVNFIGKYGKTITGKVVKVNNKTVKVLSNEGVMWAVSPQLINIVKE